MSRRRAGPGRRGAPGRRWGPGRRGAPGSPGAPGFALVELLVALAILAVMAGAAVPALAVWLNRDPTAAAEVAGLLRGARAEALATARPVTLSIHAISGRWVSEREGRLAEEGLLRLRDGAIEAPDGPLRLRFAPTGGVDGGVVSIREGDRLVVVRADRWTGEVSLDGA